MQKKACWYFCFELFQSIFIAHIMNILKTLSLEHYKYFFISLYTFFLLPISFLIWKVLPEGEKRELQWEHSPGSSRKPRSFNVQTCSFFPKAQGVIRNTPGSPPGSYTIWKEVKLPLFKQAAFPNSTFTDKCFRRDSMEQGYSALSLLHIWLHTACRLNASSPWVNQGDAGPLLTMWPGAVTLRGGYRRLTFMLGLRGCLLLPCYTPFLGLNIKRE